MGFHSQNDTDQGVSLRLARRHSAGAIRAGIDFETLLRASCVDLDPEDDSGEISRAQHLALALNLVVSLGDEGHGNTARPVKPGVCALGLRAIAPSKTLGGALEAYVRFFHLLGGSMRLQVDAGDHGVDIKIRSEAPNEEQAVAVEELWAVSTMLNLNWFAGRKLKIERFALRDRSHPSIGGRHWAFDAKSTFDACTSIRLAAGQLDLPRAFEAGNEMLWKPLLAWVDSEPAINPHARWANAHSRASDLAAVRGGSERSLRRHLAAQGRGFRRLRNDAIAEEGVKRLLRSDATVEEIAVDLGYAEARSFRRLLKSATGLTAAQIRADRRVPPGGTSQTLLYKRIRELVRQIEV